MRAACGLCNGSQSGWSIRVASMKPAQRGRNSSRKWIVRPRPHSPTGLWSACRKPACVRDKVSCNPRNGSYAKRSNCCAKTEPKRRSSSLKPAINCRKSSSPRTGMRPPGNWRGTPGPCSSVSYQMSIPMSCAREITWRHFIWCGASTCWLSGCFGEIWSAWNDRFHRTIPA
jgi:hypothetical protein